MTIGPRVEKKNRMGVKDSIEYFINRVGRTKNPGEGGEAESHFGSSDRRGGGSMGIPGKCLYHVVQKSFLVARDGGFRGTPFYFP